MARVPMIFSQADQSASGALYTVPAGKYAIVNCALGQGSGNRVEINSIVATYGERQNNGIVCPAGTTIRAYGGGSGTAATAFATGFLYDL